MGQAQTKLSDMAPKPGEQDRQLTRDELVAALEAVARILDKKKLNVELIVAGGFLSCYFFRTRDSTEDVDIIVRTLGKEEQNALRTAISEVARKQNIPPDWCNNHCELFFPPKGLGDDPVVEESRRRNLVIFERPGLRLIACSMRHVLVNKLRRMNDKDVSDTKVLFEFIQSERGTFSTKQEIETYLQTELTDNAYTWLIS